MLAANMSLPAFAENNTDSADFDAYVQTEFEKTHIPGMSVQIVDKDSVLFAQTYGNCDSLDDGFIIGSLSKSFTAVCIMQLVEQGKLSLSDPISKYLSEENQESKTTVLQLLNQTSGIKTYDTVEKHSLSDVPVEFEYANVNYGLLGKIIENVSGEDYSTYIQKNVFDPLGMEQSFTSLEKAKSSGMTPGNRNYFGFFKESEYAYPDNSYTGWITVPAGYIISSTNDMGRYMQMYLNGGANILQKTSVDEMMFNSVNFEGGYKYGMGLGTTQSSSGGLMVVHGGNVENYTTYMIMMPEQNIALIAMFNGCDYFVANEMAVKLAINSLSKYRGVGEKTLDENTYRNSHLLINVIFLVLLIIAVLPLILFKRWRTKNVTESKKRGILLTCLIHAVLPSIILAIPVLISTPMAVVKGFVPDVFIILILSSGILYLTGLIKLICYIRGAKQK